jgi:predicted glutamine amidotransferase
MGRWLAYSGSPVLIKELLLDPKHSLIDQSLHARLGAETTNGDGFGIGWYGVGDPPGVFHSIEPAWNDRNLRDLAGHIRSPLVLAHIRASSGSPVQQTNCHPFRHGRWLWMHNGVIRDLLQVERELVVAVDPSLCPEIEGSTDSETFFFLALTLGLEDDPPAAVSTLRHQYPDNPVLHGLSDETRIIVSDSRAMTSCTRSPRDHCPEEACSVMCRA